MPNHDDNHLPQDQIFRGAALGYDTKRMDSCGNNAVDICGKDESQTPRRKRGDDVGDYPWSNQPVQRRVPPRTPRPDFYPYANGGDPPGDVVRASECACDSHAWVNIIPPHWRGQRVGHTVGGSMPYAKAVHKCSRCSSIQDTLQSCTTNDAFRLTNHPAGKDGGH